VSIAAAERAPDDTVTYAFDYDGGRIGKCGTGILMVDGAVVGNGRIERTIPSAFLQDRDVPTSASPRITGDPGMRPTEATLHRRIANVTVTASADAVEPSPGQLWESSWARFDLAAASSTWTGMAETGLS
jgi:hypothetical protein